MGNRVTPTFSMLGLRGQMLLEAIQRGAPDVKVPQAVCLRGERKLRLGEEVHITIHPQGHHLCGLLVGRVRVRNERLWDTVYTVHVEAIEPPALYPDVAEALTASKKCVEPP